LNGVDTIFGVAGISITDLLRLAQNEGIRYLGFRHEQSAGNAAAIAGDLIRFVTRLARRPRASARTAGA
jgi:oxalyl-CoA decarboxylase